MLSIDFSTNSAPNFIQNTDILITLGYECQKQRTILSAQSLTITSKVGLQAMFLYQLCLFIVTKKEFFGTWFNASLE